MSRLRVAVVAPSLRILGGQAVQADQLLRAWRDDPDVDAWLVPVNPLPPGILRHAVRVKYVRTVATELTYGPLLVRELRRADVVHAFSASYTSFLLAPLPAIAVARALGRPLVLNYHSGQAPDHLRRSRVARAAIARVDKLVVQSRFLADVFAGFGLGSTIVPNIIDRQQFRFRRRECFGPRIVSTRNLEKRYNVACTLRAFDIVQRQRPDATLTVVGSGHDEPTVRALAADLGLRGVTFLGRVPPGDIWRQYDAADVYVQTPDVDNMPLSVLEAFSCGLPVVSTRVGGVPTILRDGIDGLLAAPNDHDAVAAAILRLLDDQDLARRVVAAAEARSHAYDWASVRDQWLDVYRDAVAGRGPRLAARTALTTNPRTPSS